MKNRLFRIRFQPLKAHPSSKNKHPVQDDLCILVPEKDDWIFGGVNLCGPLMYQCEPILTPDLEWCIESEVVKIQSSSVESLFYLQLYAGSWLLRKFDEINESREDLQFFAFSNCGGGFGVKDIEPATSLLYERKQLVLYVVLLNDYCKLDFVAHTREDQQSDASPFISFKLHPYVFIAEVMRLQKQFEQAVRKYDRELYDLVGSERFTQIVQTNSLIKTPEEHFDLTERYFANDLPDGYVASYPWYNLKKLFDEHLQQNNLTMQDVEDIIRKEEEKWKKENPDKMLATETIKFVKEKTNPLFFWKK